MRISLLIGCCALLGALTTSAPPAVAPKVCEAAPPTVQPVAAPAEATAVTSYSLTFRNCYELGYDEAILCHTKAQLAGVVPQALPAARSTVGQVWPAPVMPLVAYGRARASIKFKQPPCGYRRAPLPV